jgi:Predicted transcriptional regulators
MEGKPNKSKKLFHSIGEVAEEFNVNVATLRFWEKEFSTIKPKKSDNGTRFYKQEDIEAVRLVHHLLKERGMTIAGAKQKLKTSKDLTIRQEDIINKLKQIKAELISIRDAFDAVEEASASQSNNIE